MSLRTFHLVFITIATLMFVGIAFWALMLTSEEGSGVVTLGIVSSLAAFGLVGYGCYFIRKTRNLLH